MTIADRKRTKDDYDRDDIDVADARGSGGRSTTVLTKDGDPDHRAGGSHQDYERDVVGTVRAFNRFWTRAIGVLSAGLLDSDYSLTEVRVLFEMTRLSATTLTELRDALGIDSGYLSRILGRFKREQLIQAAPSANDGRRQVLTVTKKGRSLMKDLDRRASAQVSDMLASIATEDQRKLVAAMTTIRRVMDDSSPATRSFVIRALQPGDIGWVLERHGSLYSDEYGFDEDFEALVARVIADFAQHRDPKRESGWIAEVDGERAASIFCMRKTKRVAQLRLLLVEPRARRMGIGTKLVEECIKFARRVGYGEMTLWTKDVLHDARRIYERFGFTLVDEDPIEPNAKGPRGQTWRLIL